MASRAHRATIAAVHSEANLLALECFETTRLGDTTGLAHVPVERIVDEFPGYHAKVSTASQPFAARAAWIEEQTPEGPRHEIWLRPEDSAAGKRFSMAHELGHFMLKQHLGVIDRILTQAGGQMSREVLAERISDEFASLLLLPAPMLKSQFDVLRAERDGLLYLEQFAARKGVSLTMLAKRLSQVFRPGPKGWFFVTADFDVARTQGVGFALRVRTRVCPARYYLPTNQRLTSLGLGCVAARFEEMRPFSSEEWCAEALMQLRSVWRRVKVDCEGVSKKYATRSGYSYLALFGRIKSEI